MLHSEYLDRPLRTLAEVLASRPKPGERIAHTRGKGCVASAWFPSTKDWLIVRFDDGQYAPVAVHDCLTVQR
jgi:hypothetical protein